ARIKIRLFGGSIAPDDFFRTVSRAFLMSILALLVNWQNNLIDGGKLTARPASAVVENQDVPFPRYSFGNPVGIVLEVKLPIIALAGTVQLRIAPAIEQVAALATLAAGMTLGLGRGRAVIDDPELAHLVDRQHDLVEFRVVGQAIDMGPILAAQHAATRAAF